MSTLHYRVITSKSQYKEYCNLLEQLAFSGRKDKSTKDEMALLTVLIEKWDAENLASTDMDPIELLRSFLRDHEMKAKDLVDLLGVSKGYVSDILNYKKGLSKEVIRKLATYFKVSQAAFNRPYQLATSATQPGRTAAKKRKTTGRPQAA